MNIKEIIQKLHITMTDAGAQESHFESWLTLSEGIIDVIDALKALDKQEPVAFASHGVINWIADKQFQHEADLYTTQPQIEVGCAECKVGNHHALYCVACVEKFVGEAANKLQQKQETIEGLNRDYDLLFAEHQLLLKKEWVGLTDEERQDIALEVPIDAVFITEAVLKDKNT